MLLQPGGQRHPVENYASGRLALYKQTAIFLNNLQLLHKYNVLSAMCGSVGDAVSSLKHSCTEHEQGWTLRAFSAHELLVQYNIYYHLLECHYDQSYE